MVVTLDTYLKKALWAPKDTIAAEYHPDPKKNHQEMVEVDARWFVRLPKGNTTGTL